MRIDPTKTEKQIIIDQINEDNLTNYQPSDLIFSDPTPIPTADYVTLDDLVGKTDFNFLNERSYIDPDTTITVTGDPSSVYTGSHPYYYRRINLQVQWAIFNKNNFHINGNAPAFSATFDEDIYNIFKRFVNYRKESFTATRVERPDGGVEVTLTPKHNSLCYNGGVTVLFKKTAVNQTPDRILSGLVWHAPVDEHALLTP